MILTRLTLIALAAIAVLGFSPLLAPPTAAPVKVELVRGFHFGGGSRSFGSRPSVGLARRPSRARTILRHVARAAAFAAFFHFLFAGSHGLGFVFLLLIVGGLIYLVMRARRRRTYYAPPRRW